MAVLEVYLKLKESRYCFWFVSSGLIVSLDCDLSINVQALLCGAAPTELQ